MKKAIKPNINNISFTIDQILNPPGLINHNIPNYIGMREIWNEKRRSWDKITNRTVARKYSQIIELVQETKATVIKSEEYLLIEYGNGKAAIGIDELVKEVLIPELQKITVIN